MKAPDLNRAAAASWPGGPRYALRAIEKRVLLDYPHRIHVTAWFPDSMNPSYAGVYEAALPGEQRSELFACWDGGDWRQAAKTVEEAQAGRENGELWNEFREGMRWRGLAERPAAWD